MFQHRGAQGRRQGQGHPSGRVDDVPGVGRSIPVVGPEQFVAELAESSVDDDPVLGEAGSFGPLGTDLDADDGAVIGHAGPAAPVPAGLVRPASTADVEHAPRRCGRSVVVAADRDDHVADGEGAVSRSSLVLGGELEQLVVPRDHDVERFVAVGQVDDDVQRRGGAVTLGPRGGQACPSGLVGQIKDLVPGGGAQRFGAGSIGEVDADAAEIGRAHV